MSSPRIFVVSNNPLFCEGLKSLLRREAELEIVGEETKIDRAIQQLEFISPDVIILDSSRAINDSAWEQMRLLRAKKDIKVIRLSLQNNDLFIFHSTRKNIKGVEDFVEVVGNINN